MAYIKEYWTDKEKRAEQARKHTKEMAEKYPAEFETIVNLMEKVEKAEAAATRARESILNFEKKSSERSKKKITSSEKFKDCEKHGQDSMLIICEGE